MEQPERTGQTSVSGGMSNWQFTATLGIARLQAQNGVTYMSGCEIRVVHRYEQSGPGVANLAERYQRWQWENGMAQKVK